MCALNSPVEMRVTQKHRDNYLQPFLRRFSILDRYQAADSETWTASGQACIELATDSKNVQECNEALGEVRLGTKISSNLSRGASPICNRGDTHSGEKNAYFIGRDRTVPYFGFQD